MNFTEKSLNQKILNYAKSINARDVNKIRTTVVLERLVARIQLSEFLAGKIVFCGGFVLYKEGLTDRYTRDVDMISSEINHEKVINEIKKAIESDIGDGFWFGDTIIQETQDDVLYGGIRFKPLYKVGEPFPQKEEEESKLRRVHLDLSFQSLDSLIKTPSKLSPIMSQYEKILWEIYPIENIAADKIHAIISRAGLSTRSKDVYDLKHILTKCDNKKLKLALAHTFSVRDMKMVKTINETLQNIDNKNLEKNWLKIDFTEGREDFKSCWNIIVEYFENF